MHRFERVKVVLLILTFAMVTLLQGCGPVPPGHAGPWPFHLPAVAPAAPVPHP